MTKEGKNREYRREEERELPVHQQMPYCGKQGCSITDVKRLAVAEGLTLTQSSTGKYF